MAAITSTRAIRARQIDHPRALGLAPLLTLSPVVFALSIPIPVVPLVLVAIPVIAVVPFLVAVVAPPVTLLAAARLVVAALTDA